MTGSCRIPVFAALLAGLFLGAAAGTRVHSEQGRFGFEISDDWIAVPDGSLADSIELGFTHRSSVGELPGIAISFMLVEMNPSTPQAWKQHQEESPDLGPPIYDEERRILISIARPTPPVTVQRVVHFGRDRVAIFHFASPTSQFDSIRPEFEAITTSFAFDPGYGDDPLLPRRVATAAAIVAALTLLGIYLQKRTTRGSRV